MGRLMCTAIIGFFLVAGNTSSAGTGGTGYRDIDIVRIGNGFVRIWATQEWADPSSCGGASTNASVLVLEADTASYQEIVSAILAAKFAGRKIQFWVSGCATDSGNQYPKGTFVYIT